MVSASPRNGLGQRGFGVDWLQWCQLLLEMESVGHDGSSSSPPSDDDDDDAMEYDLTGMALFGSEAKDVQKGGAGNGTLMTSSVAGQKHRRTIVENCIAFLARAAEAFNAKAGTGPADRPWATSRACGISTRWLG